MGDNGGDFRAVSLLSKMSSAGGIPMETAEGRSRRHLEILDAGRCWAPGKRRISGFVTRMEMLLGRTEIIEHRAAYI